MKRTMVIFLALAMVVGMLAGCASSGNAPAATTAAATTTAAAATTAAATTAAGAATTAAATTAASEPGTTAMGNKAVQFPLTQPEHFVFMARGNGTGDWGDSTEQFTKNKFWNEMTSKANVEIEWMFLGDDAIASLTARFAAGTAGDFIAQCNTLNDAQLAQFSAAGMLMPIEQYVTDPEVMPNFNERAIAECPEIVGTMTTPDGHIYALANYNAALYNYLESPIIINVEWLKQSGLDTPKTTAELKQYLEYIRDNDCNGNGDAKDEVPALFLANNSSYIGHAAFLQMWGIGGKASALDSYVRVDNDVISFIPMTDNYRDAMVELGQWYADGLIWADAYDGDSDSANALINSELPMVGVHTNKNRPATANTEQFDYIIPPHAEGKEARSYYHPGYMGTKNMMEVTAKCAEPEILLHFVDLFYPLETNMIDQYNYPGDGLLEITADGKYHPLDMTADQKTAIMNANPPVYNLGGQFWPSVKTAYDYDNLIELSDSDKAYKAVYEKYYDAGVINPEPWPRPYFKVEDSERLGELRTDIFNIVDIQTAKWGTAQEDVLAGWDAYVASLKAAGVDEYVKICQDAYDIWKTAIENLG